MTVSTFTRDDLETLPSRFRARLINSLSGFKSANLVGTADDAGVANLAMVSSVVHLGASPPLFGMVMRPETVRRDTLSNIRQHGVWTLNAVSQPILQQAHQSSAGYEANVSEFDAVGLTADWLHGFAAPAVAESPLSMGIELVEIVPVHHNQTRFVIGKLSWLEIRRDVIQNDGFVDIEALDLVAISGLDGYHSTSKLGRLRYAVPDETADWLPDEGAGDIEPAVDLTRFKSALHR
ncbi:flavin oxidoreductase [Aliidiomarina sedimenti]|uniref:Flavin oxidoreductase n=1 Tax=Aliidiomarina sedimenti TaxID=1933879 RepID=A0ABY0C309_9GAMM|nr:flavin reductase [Aliidiomarina sedimenti]RUO32003.1 flavin oxidoreductase [Aliidiomarina sedimenti]